MTVQKCALSFDAWKLWKLGGLWATVERVPCLCFQSGPDVNEQYSSIFCFHSFLELNRDVDHCCQNWPEMCELMAVYMLRLLGRFLKHDLVVPGKRPMKTSNQCHLWKQETWEYLEKQLYLTLYADGRLCCSHGGHGAQRWSSQWAPQ